MAGDPEPGRAPGGDHAIDAVVRALVSAEAPADLRARVLARILEPAVPRAWWTPARVGWAGAAAAAILVAYLAWPRPTAPVGPIRSTPIVAESSPPAPVTALGHEKEPEARPAPRQSRASVPPTARSEAGNPPGRYRFVMPPVVAPLEEPSAVVIAPLEEPQVAIEPLGIEPLTFTPVTIDPLPEGR